MILGEIQVGLPCSVCFQICCSHKLLLWTTSPRTDTKDEGKSEQCIQCIKATRTNKPTWTSADHQPHSSRTFLSCLSDPNPSKKHLHCQFNYLFVGRIDVLDRKMHCKNGMSEGKAFLRWIIYSMFLTQFKMLHLKSCNNRFCHVKMT